MIPNKKNKKLCCSIKLYTEQAINQVKIKPGQADRKTDRYP